MLCGLLTKHRKSVNSLHVLDPDFNGYNLFDYFFLEIRCPALPRPLNGHKSENRYWVGTIVRFSCDDGYRLTGYEARRCREDGLWSWGVDPECISMYHFWL